MNLEDQLGNPVSARNRIALDLYDHAVTQLAFYRTDPIATIDEALAIDPAFIMGHCFKAGLLATTTEKRLRGRHRGRAGQPPSATSATRSNASACI